MFSAPLLKIAAPTAAQVTKGFTPSAPAAALLKPEMTPTQYVGALEQNKLSGDAIQTLSHGMPERESVWYACQSSERVADKMTPADSTALKAAQAWVKNPSPATQSQAAAAAAATDFSGPGAWAAQAAAFSTSTPGAAAPALATAGAASLTPHAAAGSVMLASAMEAGAPIPKPQVPALQAPNAPGAPAIPKLDAPSMPQFAAPEIAEAPALTEAQLAETAKIQQPYVDLGKDIASGKNSWESAA